MLFGEYLSYQFQLLEKKAKEIGINVIIHRGATVTDIIDDPSNKNVQVVINTNEHIKFDYAVVCTGHNWPSKT